MTEPCADCTQATLGPWHSFTANCPGCAARAVSRGPNFFRCRAQGKQDRLYREELQLVGVTHDQVLQAVQSDALRKAPA
jgi:tRNA(Ile2) C34 agmatinyltransferase TiaS